MKFIIEKDYDKMSRSAADIFAEHIEQNPSCVLGLATGSTPEGLYACLVKDCSDGKISFSDVTTFNLDEYCDLPVENEQSYRYFMNFNLFDHVDIAKDRTMMRLARTMSRPSKMRAGSIFSCSASGIMDISDSMSRVIALAL